MKHRWLLFPLLAALLIMVGCQPGPVSPSELAISGPKSGVTGEANSFAVAVQPVTATQPIKFTWQAAEQSPIVSTGNLTSTASFTWPTAGLRTITVTAENGAGKITKVFDFVVERPVAPDNITLSGPGSGVSGKTYHFVVSAEPMTATQPLKFTWEAQGQSPIVTTGNLTSTASLTWPTGGLQTITVTAENGAGKITKAFDFAIEIPVPQVPLEAVKTITDKQKEVKTQHIELTLALSLKLAGLTGDAAQSAALFKNFKANLNISGDVDNAKEDFALKGDIDLGPLTALITQGADKLTFEVVKVGEKMYTKSNVGDSADKWVEQAAPKAATDKANQNPLNPEMMMSLLKQSSKAEKLADDKIGDADTYRYKVTMDPAALIDLMADLAKSTDSSATIDQAQLDQAKTLLKDALVEIELWVGKSDLLMRQVKVHFNLNMKNIPDQPGATALIDLTIQDTISKINQPVTITAPK